jgi:preprotein translocase subunit SecA
VLRLVSRFAGDPNEKELNRLQPLIDEVGELEPSFKDLTEQQLRDKTAEFLGRLHAGESLDDLLPEAFAAVREASKRTTAMRHFDVQILGGIILHQGKVVEMKTGEGKTLVATLPLYLNALLGRGAHLVTVNDYLARRDVQWMGPIYHLLGLSVGLLQQGADNAFIYDPDHTRGKFPDLRPVPRKEAYQAHITYGTNHEFGFDYLRDNLAFTLDRRVQRELHYAIIDEVDNILIDEARTPLIISGPSDEPLEEYRRFARIGRKLRPDIDYEVDEKETNVILTDAGLAKVEAETGIDNIYDEANYKYVHYMEQALKAQVLYRRDRDYIKQSGRIVLVDEFTGRLMPDRRLSEGLHQAIEAKEGVTVHPRMMTQATITLQNYFRMYEKLAGMTGTAATEAEELDKIYSLDVNVLPTNVEYMAHSPDSELVEGRQREDGVEVVVYYEEDDPDEILFYKRIDYQDVVYKTEKAKWEAIADEIEELHRAGRPVLVGTTSVEKSEHLSGILEARRIKHEVLNAKNHTREAAIIARAGEPGAVTIATNMAGRGVDIKLGGELSEETMKAAHRLLRSRGMDPYRVTTAQLYSSIAEVDPDYVRHRELVLELGGLHVLGTERHEARRIDNQLRGRSARQGEPGSSRFYLSLQDDLMRRFGGPSVANLMDRLGVEEDIPIEHGMVSKVIEGSQTKVEGYNFDIRKHLLEYDDVLNRQRELIYGRRYQILTTTDLEPDLWAMLEGEIDHWLQGSFSQDGGEVAFLSYLNDILPLSLAPPDAPFSFQFPFAGNLTCFPPFSISFLAEQLAGSAPEELPEALVEMIEQASDEYRQHLLEGVVRERLETASDRYREDLETYSDFLENKIDDYFDLMDEQGREIRTQDLLQYLQNVFPIFLKVKAGELRGLSLSDAKEELLARLESIYHQELCDQLIRGTQARTPEALRLEKVKVSDIPSQILETLLSNALSTAADEAARTRLAKMAEGKGSLLDLLFNMNSLANIDLDSLNNVLSQVVAIEYDSWAERQLEEAREAVTQRTRSLEDTSAHELVRLLLDVVYTEKAAFDKAHKRRVSFAPRLPLPFLAVPLIKKMAREELRQAIPDHLEQALDAREETWGRQELTRLGQFRPTELESDFYEGLADHLGARLIEEVEEQRIADLEEELYTQVRGYLGMREIEELPLAELDAYDDLAQYLAQKLEEKVQGQRVADLDEEIIQQMEEYLLKRGYFEDATAKEALLQKPLADMDKAVREGIALHLGREMFDGLKDMPVAQWHEEVRQGVQESLQARGRFVDEEKVQRFFVHQSLRDLGEETVLEACSFIVRNRLQKFDKRPLGTLKGELQESVLDYLQRRGLFADQARRQRFEKETLADLGEAAYVSLSEHLGHRTLEAAGRISDLPQEDRLELERYLKEHDYFTDKDLGRSFRQGKVSDLGEEVYRRVRDRLLENLERDLNEKLIGELDSYVQERIYHYLEGTDYFVDENKARQFESLTLSDLEASTLHELEQERGQQIVAQLDQRKFMNLDQEVRESILRYLDMEGLFKKKKKREQFVKRSLAELDKGIRDGIAHYLGREQLTEFRGTRFGDFSEELRAQIWQHLRDNGYFFDSEKKEYLEIEEVRNLDRQLRQGLRSALKQDLEDLLSQRKVAELPEMMQASIQSYLDQQEYFVHQDRVAHFGASKIEELEPEIYATACQYLGQRILSKINGQRFSELDDGLRQEIERYLEGSDHFLDKAEREKYLQRKLGDLDGEIFEGLVESLSREMSREAMDRRAAELDEGDREYLRNYLDGIGYFVDQDALARFEEGMLTDLNLDKGDYGALASWLGERSLKENASQRFTDLEEELRENVERYLSSTGYFLDSEKLEHFREQRFVDLDEDTQSDLLQSLWQRREEAIKEKRLTELDEETRQSVEGFLSQKSAGLDEAEMAEFKGRKLGDLDEELKQGLARYLGHQRLSDIGDERIAELDAPDRAAVQGYVGGRLMHQIEQRLMLGFISRLWVDYLTAIEDLRQGIGLQAYGQMDPLVEYKRRAFGMFGELNDNIRRMVVSNVFRYPPEPLKLGQE